MTGEKTEENKEKFYFIPIGIFIKSFCGFTSRRVFFAREETLRIANTDRASMHPEENGAVADRFQSKPPECTAAAKLFTK